MLNLASAYFHSRENTSDGTCPLVMAMTVTRDNTLALSVSADHLIGRYDLTVCQRIISLRLIFEQVVRRRLAAEVM